MAKYCIHCGRKLEDGEVCTCQVNVHEKTNNLGTELLDVLKGMFIKPLDTIKKYTDVKYFNLSFIFIIVFALGMALFMMSLVGNLSASLYSGLGIYSVINYHIPYLQIFFMMLIGAIIFSFIYSGFLYLVNSIIFKGDSNFKKVFTMYGINSVVLTVALILSAILMFINLYLGLIVLSAGCMLNMFYLYQGVCNLGVKDKNKHGYICLLTTLFCMILLFIISLFLNMVSSSYNGSSNINNGQYKRISDTYSDWSNYYNSAGYYNSSHH